MGEHPRRGVKSFSFEHGGPVYGVGGQDILPDEMGAVGPERLKFLIVCRMSGCMEHLRSAGRAAAKHDDEIAKPAREVEDGKRRRRRQAKKGKEEEV